MDCLGIEDFVILWKNKNTMADYNLERFVQAQATSYATALSEMKSGAKRSHWIWYIFPQEKGLGRSYNSEFYGLDGVEEAKAYLAHPVLGNRLREITNVVLSHYGKYTIRQIMGSGIDAKKFKSSMKIFDEASPNDIFNEALVKFYPPKH